MLNNKCSVPSHATQMHRTYIIQVILLNLRVAAIQLLQYVFETQGKTQLSIYLALFLGTFGGVIFGIQLATLVSFDRAVLCWDEMVVNAMPFSAQWYLASHNTKKYTVGQCRTWILTVSFGCACSLIWTTLVPCSYQRSADSKCKKGNYHN